MRSASVSLLYYISEASGGFGGGPGPKPLSGTRPISSTPSSAKKSVYPHLDPRVMGEGGKGLMVDVAKGAVKSIAKSPLGFYGLLGSAGGGGAVEALATKATADLAANVPERFAKEVRAQQEAQYGMTNVGNFYKNLGMSSPITLLPSEDKTLASKLISALRGSSR